MQPLTQSNFEEASLQLERLSFVGILFCNIFHTKRETTNEIVFISRKIT